MCKVEWAEVQFGADAQITDWAALFRKLVEASEVLENTGALNDLGFCEYQIARYYRRRPGDNAEQTRGYLANARSAFQRTVETAKKADDSRLALISQGQIVELSFRDLGDMPAADALAALQPVVKGLETFRDDAWSTRVRRDMLLLLSEVVAVASPDEVLQTLANAWQTAIGSPLKPSAGTDAHRAAYILAQYLRKLRELGNGVDVDILSSRARSFVEQWVGPCG